MLLLLSLLLMQSCVDAFIPNSFKSILVGSRTENAYHTDITANGIDRAVADYLVSITAVGRSIDRCTGDKLDYRSAMDAVADANADTDAGDTAQRADFHFDSEQFQSSNANLRQLRNEVRRLAGQGRFDLARKSLGRALHLVQDFYSHSNWLESGHSDVQPQLGSDLDIADVAEPDAPACRPCPPGDACHNNLMDTGRLTSGYYTSVLPWDDDQTVGVERRTIIKPKSAGKCSHGGPYDKSAGWEPTGGINKDSADPHVSPHHFLHDKAAKLAVAASAKFIADLRPHLSDSVFEQLLGIRKVNCKPRRKRHGKDISGNKKSLPARIVTVFHQRISYSPITFPVDNYLQKLSVIVITSNRSDIVSVLRSSSNQSIQSNAFGRYYVERPTVGNWTLTIESLSKNRSIDGFVTVTGISSLDALIRLMHDDGLERQHPGFSRWNGTYPSTQSELYALIDIPRTFGQPTELEVFDNSTELATRYAIQQNPIVDKEFASYLVKLNRPVDLQSGWIIKGIDSIGHPFIRLKDHF